jgi:hypothetical protein
MSGRPTSRITRSATEVVLAEMATHRLSLVRYALRGALLGERLPCLPAAMPSWS